MNRTRNTIVGNGMLRFAAVGLILGVEPLALGQTFEIDWHTIDGGGGLSAFQFRSTARSAGVAVGQAPLGAPPALWYDTETLRQELDL